METWKHGKHGKHGNVESMEAWKHGSTEAWMISGSKPAVLWICQGTTPKPDKKRSQEDLRENENNSAIDL